LPRILEQLKQRIPEKLMSYKVRDRDQHLARDGTPKRILALDGGGLRGILSLALLQKIEHILQHRHGGEAMFRLCHYFDLIAGTSTGAIIAATLAMGWTVEEIRAKYMSLGAAVFRKSLLRNGLLRAKYDHEKLIAELKKVYGAKTTLGSAELKTGLLIMTKRIDTGSPWPISNNPASKYFNTRPEGVVGNSDYPLWQVVRASTAAPHFFDPESITIARVSGAKSVTGEFIDGGVSPFNNPAVMAVMYATMAGYRLSWPTGADKLFVVSVGTGAPDPEVTHASVAAKHAVRALLSLMNDTATLQETLMQWLSSSPTARIFDRELGDLQRDLVGGVPVLNYVRYNVDLRADEVKRLDPTLTDDMIESLSSLDAPQNMATLHRLGELGARREIQAEHFPAAFDLA
jgi:predicted acylesterase/phospholipase RssA